MKIRNIRFDEWQFAAMMAGTETYDQFAAMMAGRETCDQLQL